MIGIIVITLYLVAFFVAIDWLGRPRRERWHERYERHSYERPSVFAEPVRHDEQLDDQVHDRRPPTNHQRVRR